MAAEVEKAILRLALEQPSFGQDRIAQELRTRRLFVSASGVRYVWQRHDLHTLEKRVARIELVLGENPTALTKPQLIARERVRVSRRSKRLISKAVGRDGAGRADYLAVVAARLFRAVGYDATSLRDISKAADVPIGSLYYHFPSKDELFGVVYEEGVRRLTMAVTNAIAQATSPFERLLAACTAHLQQMEVDDDFTRVAIPTRLPAIGGRVKARLVKMNNGYETIFKSLIDDLQLPRQVDAGILRLLVLGALNWASIWYKSGKATPNEIAGNLVAALRLPLDPNWKT
ncbi:TetR family transcriptional regulator [Bradyrhizobium manausense]